MVNIRSRMRLRLVVVAAAVGVFAFGAAGASASNAPVEIQYQKTCVASATGVHCEGTLNGVTIKMDVTGFRQTGKVAQLTMTEEITLDDGTWFRAEMRAHQTPAGFIVLNGTVTDGAYEGAQVHQRSNFDGLVGGDPNVSDWIGELQVMPASG
jgi:hypothetical protein